MGYKAIFNVDDDADDLNAKGLGTLANPFVYEGFPPKPPTPTMKWLMKQLEKRDVGTGATRTRTYADVTKPQSDKNKYPLLTDTRGKINMITNDFNSGNRSNIKSEGQSATSP